MSKKDTISAVRKEGEAIKSDFESGAITQEEASKLFDSLRERLKCLGEEAWGELDRLINQPK